MTELARKRLIRAIAMTMCAACCLNGFAQVERTPGELYGIVASAVVQVETEHGIGSGFIVGEGRLIVTNQHVIHNAEFLTVRLGQDRRFRATVLVSDVNNDLAIIRVHQDAIRDKPFLSLEAQGLRPGDKLFAFGHPLGLSCVMTEGLTSLVAQNYVVSDININPGNSGGPITNGKGMVVGVATFSVAAARGPGLSGIVPISLASKLIADATAMLNPPTQNSGP